MKKLTLNKKTIANLNSEELMKVKGGDPTASRICTIPTQTNYSIGCTDNSQCRAC